MNQKILPFLMFGGRAEEAIHFYTSIFEGSEIHSIQCYGPRVSWQLSLVENSAS